MYVKKTCKAGATIEIEKTFSAKCGKGKKRAKREKPTAAKVKKYNQKLAEDKLRRLVNANFIHNDLHIVLTYKANQRPPPNVAAKRVCGLLEKARAAYKKMGKVLKYVAVTGFKDKDGDACENLIHCETVMHHHLIVNKCDYLVWTELWEEFGRVWLFPLDKSGDYSDLSNYFIHHTSNIFRDADSPTRQRYSSSRNLIRPEVTQKPVRADSWRNDPKPLKGYYIDTDSIRMGVSEVTGYPYQFYRMVKINPRK